MQPVLGGRDHLLDVRPAVGAERLHDLNGAEDILSEVPQDLNNVTSVFEEWASLDVPFPVVDLTSDVPKKNPCKQGLCLTGGTSKEDLATDCNLVEDKLLGVGISTN